MERIAASYERVSTAPQASQGYSLGAQSADLAAFADRLGYTLPDHLRFRDVGSGVRWDLPGLNRMLDAAEQGLFQVLLVPDIDRLGRKPAKSLLIEEQLQKLGIPVRFASMPDEGEDKLARHVLMLIAGRDREKIILRTHRGRRAKAQRGLAPGTGFIPYGYRWVVNDRGIRVGIEPDPETSPIVQRIFHDLLTTSSDRIADALNAEGIPAPRTHRWGGKTIRKLAQSSVYRGDWRFGDIPVNVPALVDPDLWESVRAAIASRTALMPKASRNRDDDPFLLRSRLICGCCGGLLSSITRKGLRYYKCGRREPRAAHKQGKPVCALPPMPAEAIEMLIIEQASELLLNPAAFEDMLATWKANYEQDQDRRRDRQEAAAKKIADLERQRVNLVRRMGLVDDEAAALFADEIARLGKTIKQVKAEMTAPAVASPTPAVWDGLTVTLGEFREDTGQEVTARIDLTDELCRRMVEKLDVRLTVRPASGDAGIALGKHTFGLEWRGVLDTGTRNESTIPYLSTGDRGGHGDRVATGAIGWPRGPPLPTGYAR